MTDRGSPLIVGQTLTGPLFNEPMWVEAVQSNRTTSWIVGLVRTSSKRFLLTGNCNPVSPSGSRKKTLARSTTNFSRDSPDESQTGINVRGFPALLQDRREVLTATSTSDNPNAWSRV